MNKIEELKLRFEEKGIKVSKAEKVKSLLQRQKALGKSKESLTDFKEPVLDLHRSNGKIETFEKATAGRFVFEHSNGGTRYIELRPEDQETRDYGGKKIRWYTAHEDRPFSGFEKPLVDGETYYLAMQKVKATDLKFEASMQKLKNENKKVLIYIILAIAGAIAIGAFAYNTWIVPSQIQQAAATVVKEVPHAGYILPFLK